MPLPSELWSANSIAELIISTKFVLVWCGLIGAYGFKWLLQLYWKGGCIKRNLKKVNKTLSNLKDSKELVKNYSNIDQIFLSCKSLKSPWLAYQQTLLKFPSDTSEDSKGAEEVKYQHIRATCRSEEYFNQDSIVQPTIDHKILTSIPNLLSGMGILGTFCGLSCGIYLARNGLAGGAMEEIQHGLAQLLSGASLAFCTSIVGILTSLIFSKIERIKVKDLYDQIGVLTSSLNALIRPVSLEQINNKIIVQNHQQNLHLEKISNYLKHIHQNKIDTNTKVLKEVAQQFHEVLINSSGQEIKYIASAFQKIHQGLKESNESLHSYGKYLVDSVESSSQMFKKNLHELTHQFHSNFKIINQEVTKTFVESSKEMKAILNQSALEMSDALKKPAVELGGTFCSLEKQIKVTGNQLFKAAQLNTESSKHILDTQNKLGNYIDPLLQAGDSISKACIDAQTSLKISATAALKISEAVKQIYQTNQQLNSSWESHCKRFEGIDRNLYQVFQHTNSSLNSYTEKVKNFTHDLDKHLSKGMLTLAEAVGDLNRLIKNMPKNLKEVEGTAKTLETKKQPFLSIRNLDHF